MTSNEAITLLRTLEDKLDSYCELNEEGKTAFRIAVEALSSSEIPNSSDTIYRQAAIDALVKAIREDPYYDSNEAINGLGVCDVRVILNDLPSAQPVLTCKGCKYDGCYYEHMRCRNCLRKERDLYEPE